MGHAKYAFKFSLDEAYRFMGISPTASPEEVKKKYRELSFTYHPDRGGDQVMMQKLNAAREVIESGGATVRPSPSRPEPQPEKRWESYREQYGPKPSGVYTTQDLKRFAQDVVDKGLLQMLIRVKVPHVPIDAGDNRGGRWTYARPFGSKGSTQRIGGMTADQLFELLVAQKYKIFDMVVRDHEAWVTWEVGGGYKSVSFEETKVVPKKDPNVGMSITAIHEYLEAKGFAITAGGSKYAYWAPQGVTEKSGRFIRESKKTLRVVKRMRLDSSYQTKLEDVGITNEMYFGAVTPEILDKWMSFIVRNQTKPV